MNRQLKEWGAQIDLLTCGYSAHSFDIKSFSLLIENGFSI
jgi:hypothetical protein